MDIVKLIRYNHLARRRYLEALKKLPWKEVVDDRCASFSSLRNIFLHALDVEDRLINYIIAGRSDKWVSYREKGYDLFKDLESIEKRLEEVEGKVEDFLEKVTPNELDRMVILPWRKETPIRVEDVLIHSLIENISHFGELIVIFWQIGEEPPYQSWPVFLSELNK